MEEIKTSAARIFDFVYLSRVLLRKWFIILIVGVITATIGFVYSNFFITPLYRANSTMLVDLRNSVHDDLSYEQVNVAEKYVSTLAYIMRTNTVLEPIIEELDLNETVASLASKIQVSPLEDTLLIRVSIRHENPKTAKSIVRAVGKIAPEIINQRITSGYITEIESPSVTAKPVTPNVLKYTVTGGAAGVIGVVLIIFLINLFNNKIKSVEELQNTVDLPLLGVIPSLDKKSGKGAKS